MLPVSLTMQGYVLGSLVKVDADVGVAVDVASCHVVAAGTPSRRQTNGMNRWPLNKGVLGEALVPFVDGIPTYYVVEGRLTCILLFPAGESREVRWTLDRLDAGWVSPSNSPSGS
jgi:hypothetical protein